MDNQTPPFNIASIHQQWLPLTMSNPAPIHGEAERYAAYYGIDFAQQFETLRHGFGYFDAAGYRLACHVWQQSKRPQGTVLIGHGYFDHVGLFRHVIHFWLQRGFNLVAFDLPGHGLSTGEPASIHDFNAYQTAMTTCIENMQSLVHPWHWLSQSTGGAIAMDFLLNTPREQQPFEQVMLLAPLVWPVGWGFGKYLHALVRPFRKSIPRRFATNSHDQTFLDFLAKDDPLQSRTLSLTWITAWKHWLPRYLAAASCDKPVTVIQGTDDTTVDWRRNLPAIQEKFPQAKIHTVAGARHQLVNESPDYRNSIFTLLDNCLIL